MAPGLQGQDYIITRPFLLPYCYFNKDKLPIEVEQLCHIMRSFLRTYCYFNKDKLSIEADLLRHIMRPLLLPYC